MPTYSLSPHLWSFGPHTYTKMKVEYPGVFCFFDFMLSFFIWLSLHSKPRVWFRFLGVQIPWCICDMNTVMDVIQKPSQWNSIHIEIHMRNGIHLCWVYFLNFTCSFRHAICKFILFFVLFCLFVFCMFKIKFLASYVFRISGCVLSHEKCNN